MASTMETRMVEVEKWLEKTAYSQFQFQMKMDSFHDEMRDFKDKMDSFHDEMREFKDEMSEFKDEMSQFKTEQQRDTREMKRAWGELANKMGTIVEDIVVPNIPRILRDHFGVEELVMMAPRIRRRHPEDRARTREFDVLALTEDTLFVNETKSTIRLSDIKTFAENYREVVEYFPEYRAYTVIPIMSSLSILPELIHAMTKEGIYAMGMGEDNMELLNGEELGSEPAT
jgi:hypothetical protein